MANKSICDAPGSGCWKAVLEAIQSDLDYLRLMFQLNRTSSHQLFCHYCDSVQWISNRSEIGPLNNRESLYTVYGPREADHPNLPNILENFLGGLPIFSHEFLSFVFLFTSATCNALRIITWEHFVELHGESPICRVIGFEPERTLDFWCFYTSIFDKPNS